jgi:hypothetical protein
LIDLGRAAAKYAAQQLAACIASTCGVPSVRSQRSKTKQTLPGVVVGDKLVMAVYSTVIEGTGKKH